MYRLARIGAPALLLVICLPFIPAAAQTATRTWVSQAGDDADPCSATSPCRTFAGALSKTVANGIINCLAPGGFGPVNITKSVTIDCAGTFGGILAGSVNGIIVNGAGIVVTIRNLAIEGIGTGRIGVNFINGAVLRIEKTNIHGFQASQAIGVNFAPPNGFSAELYIEDSVIAENGTGIVVQPVGTGIGRALINRVQVSNNASGIVISGDGNTGGAAVTVRDSTLAGNSSKGLQGITPAGGGTVRVLLVRVEAVSNGVGLISDGENSVIQVTGSSFTANKMGISSINGGTLSTYVNNHLHDNLIEDGLFTAKVPPQ
jgi:hypothetical protein